MKSAWLQAFCFLHKIQNLYRYVAGMCAAFGYWAVNAVHKLFVAKKAKDVVGPKIDMGICTVLGSVLTFAALSA